GGKQLAREHAQSQLDAALSLSQSLGDTAAAQLADSMETGPDAINPDNGKDGHKDSGHLQHHAAALKAWEAGSNTDKDGKTASSGNSSQAGQQPLLILSAPAGIASLTEQSQTLSAGSNLNLVAQRDSNETTGRRWLHNVGQHISLFVAGVKDQIALKLIAAKGKVQVQAQSDAMELTADRELTVTSAKGAVTLAAKDEILLTSGGGYIRLKGGNIEIHCPSAVSVKGASHNLSGPDRMTVAHPAFPQSLPKSALTIQIDQAAQGMKSSWAGMPFTLYADGAVVKKDVLDESGKLHIDHVVTNQKYQIEMANGIKYDIPVPNEYTNPAQGKPANQGFHGHIAGDADEAGRTSPMNSVREDFLAMAQKGSKNG
ncbi:DUF2345 domain-containing protein, partial [Aquitalea sp. LB_tupeE]|uniref:DUF2345 domain-containing protein n=1 Tax=Aquitalea sp. LB_tupeE TaxID=2748078 RepID=UPI0021024793